MSDGQTATISEGAVREELELILASPDFIASERNRRFLRHVVEETLAGRAERIKAYSIATAVFGRPDDFDPLQDSIVRIEAARLRRAIERYYLLAGERPGTRILIPKGTYVPAFSDSAGDGAAPPPSDPALHQLGPRLLVEQFDLEGDLASCPTIGRTLTRQVIAALTRFTELFVYGFATSETGLPRADPELIIDYRLSGTLTLSRDRLHVDLLMARQSDGRFVWTQGFDRGIGLDREPAQIVALCGEIAGHVARVLALRDGILDSQAREAGGAAPRHFEGYQKLLDFHDYWRGLDPDRFEPLRRDLEVAIAADPHFAGAFSCLSLLYSNAARYGFDVSATTDAPLARALDLAQQAVRLAPNSSKAHHAKAVAEWFLGLPEIAFETLLTARALNPNDPELLAELGFRHAMRMNWEAAVPLLEEAYIRNPQQSVQYRMGLFLYHFAHHRHDEALREVRDIAAPGLGYVHLAQAVALGELGRLEDARLKLDQAGAQMPGIRARLHEDLAFRQMHPDLIAMIADAVSRIDRGWTRRGAGTRPG